MPNLDTDLHSTFSVTSDEAATKLCRLCDHLTRCCCFADNSQKSTKIFRCAAAGSKCTVDTAPRIVKEVIYSQENPEELSLYHQLNERTPSFCAQNPQDGHQEFDCETRFYLLRDAAMDTIRDYRKLCRAEERALKRSRPMIQD